jgi:hypothetical protein
MTRLTIAMWSGPRTISTALMRSWESRPDTVVWDEPLYAHYLAHTGLEHPGRDEVVARHETDWRKVVAALTGPVPGGKPIFYQKHMAHHLLPEIDRGWLDRVVSCFLIRDPREMLLSLARKLPSPTLSDTGLPQQVEIFRRARDRVGTVPPVVDARDVLLDPGGVLRRLCRAVGVAFTPAMLSWSPGRRETDGVWARHWYENVERSTGFEPFVPRTESLPDALGPLHDRCVEYYQVLSAHRLAPDSG